MVGFAAGLAGAAAGAEAGGGADACATVVGAALAGSALEGAAAVPCSPALADDAFACASLAGGFCRARFVLAVVGAGVVWASAPPAEALIAAARQSERSMPLGSGEIDREGARVACDAARGQGEETCANRGCAL